MRLVVGSLACLALLGSTTQSSADPEPPPTTPPTVATTTTSSSADPTEAPGPDPAPPPAPPPPAIDAPPPSQPALDVAPKPKPPPYSLPWQLRPVIAPTVIRSDNTAATYEDAGGRGGTTVATGLTGSIRIPGTGEPGAGLAIVGRLMMVDDSPPSTPPPPAPAAPPPTSGGLALVNPLLGAAYAMKHGKPFRSNLFLGFALPVGMGGGNSPDRGLVNSRSKGVPARAAMDNALFAVNDFTVIPGASVAYVSSGFTAQVEATLLHLMRVRGDQVQGEASKTNFTAGVHAGYFFLPFLSAGAELRYQRWINAPFAVERDKTGASEDNLTVAFGPRFHVNAGPVWIRPGVAYWRGLDKPLAAATPNYNSVQIDVPVLF